MYICMYVCITYIVDMYTDRQTDMYYIHTQIHAYIHTYVPTKQTHTYTHIHTYIHTYITIKKTYPCSVMSSSFHRQYRSTSLKMVCMITFTLDLKNTDTTTRPPGDRNFLQRSNTALHTRRRTGMYVCMYVCICVYVCVCLYACRKVSLPTNEMEIQRHIQTHTYIHTYMHTYLDIQYINTKNAIKDVMVSGNINSIYYSMYLHSYI